MERFQELWRKSKAETFKVFFSSILILCFMLVPPLVGGNKYLLLTFIGAIGFIIPYFIKDPMVDYEYFGPILKYVGYFLYFGIIPFKDHIVKANIISQSVTLGVFAFYVSCCFWVVSDKRIVYIKKGQDDRIRH